MNKTANPVHKFHHKSQSWSHLSSAIFTIACRDWLKLLRDRGRLLAGLIFPLIFIGVLGGSLDANLSKDVGYNFLVFVFTGVLGQTLFQSTAAGLISLVEDRQSDFSQELFVAPVPRWAILVGKILGESLVAFTQLFGILAMSILFGVTWDVGQLIRVLLASAIVCFFGGAFGVMVLSKLTDQRQANQIFPFVIFPQFFLAGVFSPIKDLPPHLWVLSRLAPMTYGVDLVRQAYYAGLPEVDKVTLLSAPVVLTVIAVLFVVFLGIGTWLFVKNERER